MDGYYLLTTKSAPSRFPTCRKDHPIVGASREDSGKETVPGSRKQGCVHPDSTDVGHTSPALGPNATCAGPLSHPQKTEQTLHTSWSLLPKRKSPFTNGQAQVGDKEEVTQEKELHTDF